MSSGKRTINIEIRDGDGNVEADSEVVFEDIEDLRNKNNINMMERIVSRLMHEVKQKDDEEQDPDRGR